MASFFKKALGVFVEFEEDPQAAGQPAAVPVAGASIPRPVSNTSGATPVVAVAGINEAELEKFEKHFEKLFDDANLPGPDYFEFWKMMEKFEAHIPAENARMAAVYDALSIQGLTKQKLVESATHYKGIIEKDQAEFEKAFGQKSQAELDARAKTVQGLEEKISANMEQIKKLQQEIGEAQAKIATLKGEINQEEQKLASRKTGYSIACGAMLSKLGSDIQKIQTVIQ